MVTVGLLLRLEAKPGKETDVENFLKGALPIVQEEPATTGVVRHSDRAIHVRYLRRLPR